MIRGQRTARLALAVAVLTVVIATGCATAPEPVPVITPAARGWTVSASTVGLARVGLSCDALPAYAGPGKVPAGTTITGALITTPLDLSAGDITIEQSCLRPTEVGRGASIVTTTDADNAPAAGLVTIRDSEISGDQLDPKAAAWTTGFTGIADLSGNYVHHVGSGIALVNTGADLDALIEGNYVTNLLATGNPATTGNHSDAFTIRDFTAADNPGRQVVVRNNRFDCDSRSATGAFFIQAWAGPIDNLTIEGNLLEGAGYQLGLETNNFGYSNITATDNRFTGTGYGPAYRTGGSGWTSWQDNYLYSPTDPEAKGTPVPAP